MTRPLLSLEQAMTLGPVIPVLVIDRVDDAVPLARALLAGGVNTLEVTLRTPVAMDVIRALAAEVPQAVILAGTITTPEQWEAAHHAGAHFGVSPGLTPRLLSALRSGSPMPLLPGVATASELMTAMDAACASAVMWSHCPALTAAEGASHEPPTQATFGRSR